RMSTAVAPEPVFHQIRARGRLRGSVALLGPAFVAAVAYVDPGNFATNFTAGAKFGYTLVWVIVVANLTAMLVQYLSAKAGVAAGLAPRLAGGDSLLLVCGIIGATVMPHVVYLHSALTKSRVACRDDGERRELLRFQRIDVVIGLGMAGLINLSMLLVAAS